MFQILFQLTQCRNSRQQTMKIKLPEYSLHLKTANHRSNQYTSRNEPKTISAKYFQRTRNQRLLTIWQLLVQKYLYTNHQYANRTISYRNYHHNSLNLSNTVQCYQFGSMAPFRKKAKTQINSYQHMLNKRVENASVLQQNKSGQKQANAITRVCTQHCSSTILPYQKQYQRSTMNHSIQEK